MDNSKKVISLIGGIVLGISSISTAIANTDISGAEKLLRTRMNVKPMNLSKDATTEDLIASGQLGGHLFPTSEEEADLTPLKTMKSKHRKKGKNKKAKRARKMRNDFAKAIQSWNKHEYKEAYKDFKKYMQEYPNSPWAAEAHLHMGCEARYNGRYSEAESTFKQIIEQYAGQEYVGSKMLADKAKSRLGVLKYLQNNQHESAEYFQDIKENSKDWRLRTYASNWLMKLGKAKKQGTNELLDCGIRAMAYMLKTKGKKKQAKEVIALKPKGDKGQSIAELKSMAEKYGFDLTAINIDVDQIKDIPLPAIAQVDNKQGNGIGHYWIIEKVKNNVLTIRDQQAPRRFQQTTEEFAKEWNGNALVFAKPDGLPGNILSKAEMDLIYGGCCGVQAPEGSLGLPFGPVLPGGPEVCDDPKGAPIWIINPINMNLYMTDIPLWYTPEYGPNIEITLSYNSQSAIAQNEIFGNKWVLNYSSYLVVDPGQTVTIFMPDGRRDVYILDSSGQNYISPVGVYNQLEKLDENHFLLKFPDGWIHEYNIPSGTNSLQPFLVKITDNNNLSVSLGYDEDIRLSTITDATGKVSSFDYYLGGVKHGLVNTITGPYGRVANFEYDDSRNLTKLTDMGGYWTELEYDEDVYLTKLRNAKGEWKFYIEPADGNDAGYGEVTMDNAYPAPGSNTWENYRITITNPAGGKEEYYYNGYGGNGWYVSPKHYIEYRAPVNRPAGLIDAGANNYIDAKKTLYNYTTTGNEGKISKVTTPEGIEINYFYDPDSGLLNKEINELGQISQYEYNDVGNIKTVTTWDNKQIIYTYDESGQLLKSYDSALGKAYFEYDSNRRLIKYTDFNNKDVEYTYNEFGQMLSVSDQLLDVTYYDYNNFQQLQTVRRNEATVASYTYDEKGRVKKLTDASDYTIEYKYNDLNSVTEIIYPDGQKDTYSYPHLPHLSENETLRGNQVFEYSYDGLKRLLNTKGLGKVVTHYHYDANNYLSSFVDSNQNKTEFKYDGDNRLIKKIYPDETELVINYDNDNNHITRIVNGRGIWKAISYYPSGNIEKIYYSDDTPSVTFDYDEHHRLVEVSDAVGITKYTYNSLSYLKTIDGPWENDTITYSYDDLGRVKTMAVEGNELTEYYYDSLDRIDFIKVGTEEYDYSYKGNSNLIEKITYPNGSFSEYTYNDLNHLELLSNIKEGQTLISSFGFKYNDRDLISEENRIGTLPFVRKSNLENYANNKLNQVIQKNSNIYSYDLDGNLTQGYTPDGYQYIATYDAENRLKSLSFLDGNEVERRKEYVYNSSNLLARVKTYENNVLEHDIRIVRGKFLALQDRDENNNIIRKYNWGINVGGGVGGLLSFYQGDAKYYYHYDGRNNITALIDEQQQIAAKYLYDEYGKIINSYENIEQPFKFSTKRHDKDTGLIYFGYRYYTPELQKWLNRDPIGEDGGINLYGYVESDPVNNIDPYGLCGRPGRAVPCLGVRCGCAGGPSGGGMIGGSRGGGGRGGFRLYPRQGKSAAGKSRPVKGPKHNNGDAKPHGGTKHNSAIDNMVKDLKNDPAVKNIRKNQQQVDVNGNKVGTNRPDIQYDKNGKHYNIEYDNSLRNSRKHGEKIRANDPKSSVELNIL